MTTIREAMTSTPVPDYRDLLDDLMRALARDAARADHDATLAEISLSRRPTK